LIEESASEVQSTPREFAKTYRKRLPKGEKHMISNMVVAIASFKAAGMLRLARFLLIVYIVQLFTFAPSDAACGRVNGVFCNGGVCAAGICQCPNHLVGENWSVERVCLSFA
jgi:hypothetical protein